MYPIESNTSTRPDGSGTIVGHYRVLAVINGRTYFTTDKAPKPYNQDVFYTNNEKALNNAGYPLYCNWLCTLAAWPVWLASKGLDLDV